MPPFWRSPFYSLGPRCCDLPHGTEGPVDLVQLFLDLSLLLGRLLCRCPRGRSVQTFAVVGAWVSRCFCVAWSPLAPFSPVLSFSAFRRAAVTSRVSADRSGRSVGRAAKGAAPFFPLVLPTGSENPYPGRRRASLRHCPESPRGGCPVGQYSRGFWLDQTSGRESCGSLVPNSTTYGTALSHNDYGHNGY